MQRSLLQYSNQHPICGRRSHEPHAAHRDLSGSGVGSLVIFIVNLLSAAVGHGGWGLVGANAIINVSEIAIAFYVFRTTKNRLEMFTRGAAAAISGFLVGNLVFLAAVAVSGIQGSELRGVALLPHLIQVVILNLVVAVGEAVVTGFVVDYLSKVRPDLLGD